MALNCNHEAAPEEPRMIVARVGETDFGINDVEECNIETMISLLRHGVLLKEIGGR